MEPFEPYDYMVCVRDLFYLKSLREGEPIRGRGDLLNRGVIEHIDDLVQRLENSNLKATLGSDDCNDLKSVGEALRSRVAENSSAHISTEEVDLIRRFSSKMEIILFAESHNITVYELGGSDIHLDSEMLLNGISRLFDTGVFDLLPVLAAENFREAGRSLAFQLPMAAAMLSFRGCEALFRAYFFLSGVEGRGTALRASGQLLRDLDKFWEHKDSFSETLESMWNVVRMRNRTMHPEGYYNIRRADTLLTVCSDVCNLIIRDLVNDIDKFKRFGDFRKRKQLRGSSKEARIREVRDRMHSEEIQVTLYRSIRMEPQIELDNEPSSR